MEPYILAYILVCIVLIPLPAASFFLASLQAAKSKQAESKQITETELALSGAKQQAQRVQFRVRGGALQLGWLLFVIGCVRERERACVSLCA